LIICLSFSIPFIRNSFAKKWRCPCCMSQASPHCLRIACLRSPPGRLEAGPAGVRTVFLWSPTGTARATLNHARVGRHPGQALAHSSIPAKGGVAFCCRGKPEFNIVYVPLFSCLCNSCLIQPMSSRGFPLTIGQKRLFIILGGCNANVCVYHLRS